jgi:acetyl-CoA acyltransferase 1
LSSGARGDIADPWILQGKKGGFKDTRPEEILSAVLRAAYFKVNLDPALIGDIQVGNVLPPVHLAHAWPLSTLAYLTASQSALLTDNARLV